jgi:hypothetical protein
MAAVIGAIEVDAVPTVRRFNDAPSWFCFVPAARTGQFAIAAVIVA